MNQKTMDAASMDRRLVIRLTGAAALGAVALPLLKPGKARADVIMTDDPRITVSTVTIPGVAANLTGLLAVPSQMPKAKVGGVVVIGNNRGLTQVTRDVVKRYATEGFVALGVDYLGPLGGTPDDIILGPALTAKLRPGEAVDYVRQAVAYLKSRPDVSRVGAVGYAWGGGVLNDLAAAEPNLSAAVGFYGHPPDLSKVSKVRAPLQEHYGALDDRALADLPAFEEALRKAGKTYEVYIYPGDRTGFADDTNPYRYDQLQGDVAWNRSIDFLRKNLEG